MNLNGIGEDFLQAPRIQALKQQIESAQNEAEKQKFLTSLVREIVKSVNSISSQKFDDGVNVKNFDEVTASLRNELTKANKPIAELLKSLNLSTSEQTKLISEIDNKSREEFQQQYQTVVVKRVKDVVSVDNLNEIPIIDKVSVKNLGDLEKYFKNLEGVLRTALQINLPAPQVTVNPQAVNIPETQVNVPPVDLLPLLEAVYALDESLKKIRNNNKSNPLAVRLTDGAEWIKELIKVQKETSKAVAAFAGGADSVRLLGPNKDYINPVGMTIPALVGDGSKTVASAGTRVQLASNTPCRYVIVVALSTNTDVIWLGGTTVAAGSGRPLVALQSEKIDIDNLNKVWIDSVVNGEGVTFSYVN